ncbi:Unannotated [Lentimonas sp. CC19]|nr:Unannotated [Lentimonas sp. CC10]CAA6691078.1 Unannotated [Lentimonas sp. CC19]CAA7069308.1 Unannotated [Lentimonas sp. CC11]
MISKMQIIQKIRVALLLSVALMAGLSVDAAERPNIIFMLTDDQRWDDLGAAGNEVIITPNLDKLAENGTLFSQATVSSPICMASRATCFLGQTERRHGVNFSSGRPLKPDAWVNSYPAILRDHGYQTGFIGKIGIEARFLATSFDYWKGFFKQGTYAQPNGQHLTTVIGDQALEFFEKRDKDKNFVLSISFKAPHFDGKEGLPSLPKFEDLYKDVDIPLRGEEFKKIEKPLVNSFTGPRYETYYSTPEKRAETIRKRYRLITGVDHCVGRVVDALEKYGLSDNTVIIFMGDNGYLTGEHAMAEKYFMYEESLRVPLIVYDPRLPENQRSIKSKALASNIDIAPTIIDLAQLPQASSMQGESLMQMIKGKSNGRDAVFCENLYKARGDLLCDTIRTEKWKLIEYFNNPEYDAELYNLEKDGNEAVDLIGNPEYALVVEELRVKLQALRVMHAGHESGWVDGKAVVSRNKGASGRKNKSEK